MTQPVKLSLEKYQDTTQGISSKPLETWKEEMEKNTAYYLFKEKNLIFFSTAGKTLADKLNTLGIRFNMKLNLICMFLMAANEREISLTIASLKKSTALTMIFYLL